MALFSLLNELMSGIWSAELPMSRPALGFARQDRLQS
jgi:hypothetical protein